MNQRPLSAAYEHMTNLQLAAAAYAYADNELESLRIQSAVPRKTYSMLDAEFINRLECINTAGYVWGIDYWRLRSLYAADIMKSTHDHIKGELKDVTVFLELMATWMKIFVAHFEGLKEVCEAHGIDYKSVLERTCITESTDKTMGINLDHKNSVIKALETILTTCE